MMYYKKILPFSFVGNGGLLIANFASFRSVFLLRSNHLLSYFQDVFPLQKEMNVPKILIFGPFSEENGVGRLGCLQSHKLSFWFKLFGFQNKHVITIFLQIYRKRCMDHRIQKENKEHFLFNKTRSLPPVQILRNIFQYEFLFKANYKIIEFYMPTIIIQ